MEKMPPPHRPDLSRVTVRTGAQWMEAISLLRVTVRTGAQWTEAIAAAIMHYI